MGTAVPKDLRRFRKEIRGHYRNHARDLPWRKTENPYHILISEIMLQQTQVGRVIEKYERFILSFPDFHALAEAPLRDILLVWRGLGYNRRAVALKGIAERVITEFNGVLPRSEEELVKLPGIGRATASAVAAFAFNTPAVFIETNIRRVFIHFFFHGREQVADREILPLIRQTLDKSDPRTWYYALMDYGAMLKTKVENPNRRSAHYHRQSRFEGSHRKARGLILKEVVEEHPVTVVSLRRKLGLPPAEIREVLKELEGEGFIGKTGKGYSVV